MHKDSKTILLMYNILVREGQKDVATNLVHLIAAGGLVTNRKGEVLLIYKYGKWDLPKGGQELGEGLDFTAVREVSEECGLRESELVVEGFLCTTHHSFERDGALNMKESYWYRIRFVGEDDTTTPEQEESIERSIWVSPEELPRYLSNSYPTIRDVFEEAGY